MLGFGIHVNKIVSSRCVNSLYDMSASFHRITQRPRSKKSLEKGGRTHFWVGYVMRPGTPGLGP